MSTTSPELVHEYTPHGGARELFSCRDSEVVISGPAGTGKSRAALTKVHLAMLRTPGARALVVRKTAVSLGSTTLVTWRKTVAKEAIDTGAVTFYGGSPQEAASYRYDNGSTIVVGGMDKPDRIMSSEYDLAFVDEATELTETDWEAISTRLRNNRLSFQQLIGACNPSSPKHWLKQRTDRGAARMLYSRHADNPAYVNPDGTLTPAGEAYLARLDALTGVRRARLFEGKWVSAEGQVYAGFDDAVHLLDPFPIPDSWPRYWSVDFGYTNPFVLQCWAEDPDGRLYLYREIYRTRRTVDEHAATILDHVTTGDGTWREPRPVAVVCDHDAEGRAVLERELNLDTTPAHKAVTEGIQAVQGRLKVAGDGKPRLFLFKDAVVERDPELVEAKRPVCTADEIGGYVWARDRDGRERDQVEKNDDHGMDAKRYLVAHLDLAEKNEVVAVGGFGW